MKVTIVGGGLTGLTAAYYLGHAKPDWQIQLYEQAPRFGGKIQTQQVDDFVVELILSNDFQKGIISKPEYIAKIKELISIEFNKEMMVKIVDNLKKDGENSLDLGFNINVIE